MTLHYILGLIVGFVAGFGLHQIILQLAYRRGIVEYKGIKK